MPRNNRPRGRRPGEGDDEELDLGRALMGVKRTERKRTGLWTVQSQSASKSVKVYTCPGCGLEIAPGIAHLVAWRADDIMGEENAVAARRHWHTHCWRVEP